jgi:uncharacterized membrane protein YozB (DUF420 family)
MQMSAALGVALLIVHPVVQLAGIGLSLCALFLGIQRIRSAHFNHGKGFRWRRHVSLGSIAFITWIFGSAGGIWMVHRFFHGYLITGVHATTALWMAPLIFFGLFSGWVMDRWKKKRKWLPLLHGLNNSLAVLLALSQIISGLWVLRVFVLGN